MKVPCKSPVAIHLYAASVKCIPSQLAYTEVSLQISLADGSPHSAENLKLYGPPAPQHATKTPFRKPVIIH